MTDSSPAGRTVTNELLAELRSGRWRPPAWGRFLGRAAVRSWAAARQRPRAVAEVTALHAAVLSALSRGHSHRPGAYWVAMSWALSISHLGMLESTRSLGVANVVTLVRANLPPIATIVRHGDGRVIAATALVSDLVDGHLARRWGTTTPFGRYADSLADTAFWTWFALHHEPDRRIRLLALGAWIAPVVTVMVISVARGRMIDPLRPTVARPAAVMQLVLTARATRRSRHSGRSTTRRARTLRG